MSNIPRTVAIKYGWAEGPWHATRFVRELQARGFTVIDDVAAADIIFAHSSGCYQIPKKATARLIVLVGLPCGPIRHLAFKMTQKEALEFSYHRRKKELGWWLNKLLHNGWYMITRPKATYYTLTKHKEENLPDRAGRRVVLVRPSNDIFMWPDSGEWLVGKGYEYKEIAGSHDSCWVEPHPYVDLMA